MSTINKSTTSSYVKWGDIPVTSTVYIQNVGNYKAKVTFADSAPSESDFGIILYPDDLGVSITLTGTDEVYIKSLDSTTETTLVAVL